MLRMAETFDLFGPRPTGRLPKRSTDRLHREGNMTRFEVLELVRYWETGLAVYLIIARFQLTGAKEQQARAIWNALERVYHRRIRNGH